MKRLSLRYTLLTSCFDQLWLPLAFWLLFVIIGLIRGSEYMTDTTRSYLGAVIPLLGGIMAAYAILDDSALELRFATPITAAQTLLERLAPTFFVQVASSIAFQIFVFFMNTDFSVFGGWVNVQLAWLLPTLALMAFGCLTALLAAQTVIGAVFAGMVWLVELVARSWFAGNFGKYFLIFMGALMPDHPDLNANQISLFTLSIIFLVAAWSLLHRQERYI
ncbi:MAG TPA: hypothetical protein VK206_07525 [Anaerolineales bacterium]|nr:hypothetical protein [Anaerolineales bacterium]